jgi:predicted ATP-dependent endonuclease of OLD family
MIDLARRNSTLIRMVNNGAGTKLHQVKDLDLQEAKGTLEMADLKQAMYEVLRFNPHICESFYADEVVLVEGPTEEIIIRGILQKSNSNKDLFIVNCGSVTNIPFYQKVYQKFFIKYHVICDVDSSIMGEIDEFGNPTFTSGIQHTIYNQHRQSCLNPQRIGGLLRVHDSTFEPAHQSETVQENLRYPDYTNSHGKPYNANKYWSEVLEPNFENDGRLSVPIIAYIEEILAFTW